MITFQEYLDQKYPTQSEKEQVTEIIIGSYTLPLAETSQLAGSKLKLFYYPNLKEVWIDGCELKNKLTNLDLSNCSQLIKLDVSYNQLKILDLSHCVQLQELNCYNNSLTKLVLHPQAKLKWLDVDNNNFSDSDKSFLRWIAQGFNSQEATEWNKINCQPQEAEQWSRSGFTPKQTQQWLNNCLTPQESYLVAWIRDKKQLTTKQIDNDILSKLKEEYNNSLVQAQEWLAQHYPNQEKTWSIYANQLLGGVLDCSKYKNLRHIHVSSLVDSNRFEIIKGSYKEYNKEKYETKVIFCYSTQTYLGRKYPTQVERAKITQLDISYQGLERSLDLSDFVNLQELNCSNNYFTRIIYPINLVTITKLNLSNNNLIAYDCTVFSDMRSLTELKIGNWDENKIQAGICNRFSGSLVPLRGLAELKWLDIGNTNISGSLEYLKDLNKLYSLDISNTNIDSGLEYLPASLQKFNCSVKLKPDAKCQTLFNYFANDQGEVETYFNSEIKNFPQKLKEYKQKAKQKASLLFQEEFQAQDQLIQELQNQNQSLQTQIESQTQTIQTLQNQLQNLTHFNHELTQQKEQLEQQNTQLESEINHLQEQITAKEQATTNNSDNQALIEQLQQEKQALEAQLASKEQELTNLQKLILQQLINKKQTELEQLKSDIKQGRNLHLVDFICQLQTEINKLEHQLTEQLINFNNAQWDQIIAELINRQEAIEQTQQFKY